jgi:hypothetical protein
MLRHLLGADQRGLRHRQARSDDLFVSHNLRAQTRLVSVPKQRGALRLCRMAFAVFLEPP